MREIDEKNYWEDLFQFGKYLHESSEREGKLELGIRLYSRFLGDSDRNYLYNDTFLPLFIEKFLCFAKFFYRKYPLITELMSVCEGRKEIELTIDQYWKIEGRIQGNKCFVLEKSSYDSVCQEKIEVKAVLLIEAKRYIFHSNIKLTDDIDNNKKELCKLKEELEKFIEIHMGK